MKIKKTDDGFIAVGAVKNGDGGAVGVVRHENGQTRIRAAKRDGNEVSWGGVNCRGGRCTGGRTTVKIKDYDYYPYYYYPYYYGYYSCPYGATTWYGDYGNPVYGCANVVVISTTVSLGVAEQSNNRSSMTAGRAWTREAELSSAPVVMYAISDEVVAYQTSYEPEGGVYAEKIDDRWVWVPGPAEASPEAKRAIEGAAGQKTPTANATVITYTVDERVVYLTNERPLPGFYSVEADRLFVWIPGVREPGDAEHRLIEEVIEAHEGGGQAALDREVRKLELNRDPPPDATS